VQPVIQKPGWLAALLFAVLAVMLLGVDASEDGGAEDVEAFDAAAGVEREGVAPERRMLTLMSSVVHTCGAEHPVELGRVPTDVVACRTLMISTDEGTLSNTACFILFGDAEGWQRIEGETDVSGLLVVPAVSPGSRIAMVGTYGSRGPMYASVTNRRAGDRVVLKLPTRIPIELRDLTLKSPGAGAEATGR
jgi:hypothetical protein